MSGLRCRERFVSVQFFTSSLSRRACQPLVCFKALLGVAMIGLVAASPAAALPACTAADIVGQDPGCASGSDPCVIALDFEVGDGCTLDFGTRSVTVATSAVISAAVGAEHVGVITIKAADLTVAGIISATGTGSTGPQSHAGTINVVTTGNVSVDSSSAVGRIDVSHGAVTGSIQITAGGSVNIKGRIAADGQGVVSAGNIEIDAGGDIVSTSTSFISAAGTTNQGAGGDIALYANGAVRLGASIFVSGTDGGSVTIDTSAQVEVAGIVASGSAGGDGGDVDITSGAGVRVFGPILVRGSNSADGGGSGGVVGIDALDGDISIEANVDAGSGVDGIAGDMDLQASAALTIAPNINVAAAGIGGESSGGTISLAAATMLVQGTVDARGYIEGGSVDISSTTQIRLDGDVRADGFLTGSFGGDVTIEAGARLNGHVSGTAALVVTGSIDVGGGGCSTTLGCGFGGSATLEGCEVRIEASSMISARAATGGAIGITAHRTLTVDGSIDATQNGSTGTNGSVSLTYPLMSLSPADGGDVSPAPARSPMSLCSSADQTDCLIPCPVCGNGAVEYPESCDLGDVVNCDGCSAFCELEDNCSDGRVCTIDLCDPVKGCYSVPAPTPCVEPPTPTPTITPTGTETPTITLTPRESYTPTVTSTLPPSPTTTLTAAISVTATPTPSASPTRSPTPGLLGDASCDHRISAADFVALVMAIDAQRTVCGADVNGDGSVDSEDLAALQRLLFGD